MAGRYVPPALRKKLGDSSAPSEPLQAARSPSPPQNRQGHNTLYTDLEILRHFWPEGRHVDDLPLTPLSQRATLNDSAATRHKLTWILLFHNANPRWISDRIIFVKSNLDLLPEQQSSSTSNSNPANPSSPQLQSLNTQQETQNPEQQSESATLQTEESAPAQEKSLSDPIAVFEQVRRATRSFRFAGWYRISRLQYLEPQSPELVRMLAQKWEVKDRSGRTHQRQRDEKGWEQSLKQRWAVIQMVRDEAADKERGEPAIERGEDEAPERERAGRQREMKSVNEMLREMRLGDQKKAGSENRPPGHAAASERKEKDDEGFQEWSAGSV